MFLFIVDATHKVSSLLESAAPLSYLCSEVTDPEMHLACSCAIRC